MKEEEEIKVYGPSHFYTVIFGALGLYLTGSAPALIINAVTEMALGELFAAGSVLMLGVLFLWAFYDRKVRKNPQLTLTTEGIEYQNVKGREFYSWNEVGKFKLGVTFVYIGVAKATYYRNNKLHESDIKPLSASQEQKDISFLISSLDHGLSFFNEQPLVDEINSWREKYGAPENNAFEPSASQIRAIKKVRREQRVSATKTMISLVIISIIVLLLFRQ